MIKVGQKAPNFSCDVVIGDQIKQGFSLADMAGKYKVIFFYPADFTFVCPTELHAFQSKLSEFEKKNVAVVGVSTDSAESHKRWLETPKQEGGVKGITYPLVADSCKKMAEDYGVFDENENVALRGLFLLDKDDIVQVAVIHNLPIGRSVDEALRVVDALQFHEKNGQVCPANWMSGDEAIETTKESVSDYLSKK